MVIIYEAGRLSGLWYFKHCCWYCNRAADTSKTYQLLSICNTCWVV